MFRGGGVLLNIFENLKLAHFLHISLFRCVPLEISQFLSNLISPKTESVLVDGA